MYTSHIKRHLQPFLLLNAIELVFFSLPHLLHIIIVIPTNLYQADANCEENTGASHKLRAIFINKLRIFRNLFFLIRCEQVRRVKKKIVHGLQALSN